MVQTNGTIHGANPWHFNVIVMFDRSWSNRANLDITHLTFQDGEDVEVPFPFRLTAARLMDRRSDDLEALALGIDMERSALELYRQASMAAKDREVKKAYEFLLRAKSRYYDRLRDQWKELAGIPFDESMERTTVRVQGEWSGG